MERLDSAQIEAEVAKLRASNPNVRPAQPYSTSLTGPLFDPKDTVIARLAKVAEKKKVQPTAGSVGIERQGEIKVEVPPECLLYETDYFPFRLGKMPKDLFDEPQQTPVSTSDPSEAKSPEADQNEKDLEKEFEGQAVSAFQEAQELAAEQIQAASVVKEMQEQVASEEQEKQVESEKDPQDLELGNEPEEVVGAVKKVAEGQKQAKTLTVKAKVPTTSSTKVKQQVKALEGKAAPGTGNVGNAAKKAPVKKLTQPNMRFK